MAISALLARIRQLIPKQKDDCYGEIARGSGNGALRTLPSPMTDGELSRAIAEFLKDTPSSGILSRPKSARASHAIEAGPPIDL